MRRFPQRGAGAPGRGRAPRRGRSCTFSTRSWRPARRRSHSWRARARTVRLRHLWLPAKDCVACGGPERRSSAGGGPGQPAVSWPSAGRAWARGGRPGGQAEPPEDPPHRPPRRAAQGRARRRPPRRTGPPPRQAGRPLRGPALPPPSRRPTVPGALPTAPPVARSPRPHAPPRPHPGRNEGRAKSGNFYLKQTSCSKVTLSAHGPTGEVRSRGRRGPSKVRAGGCARRGPHTGPRGLECGPRGKYKNKLCGPASLSPPLCRRVPAAQRSLARGRRVQAEPRAGRRGRGQRRAPASSRAARAPQASRCAPGPSWTKLALLLLLAVTYKPQGLWPGVHTEGLKEPPPRGGAQHPHDPLPRPGTHLSSLAPASSAPASPPGSFSISSSPSSMSSSWPDSDGV